jgi:hypothetical protein
MKSIKKDQRGVINHLLLVAIAVVVVGTTGFAGYKVYQNKYGIKAKAAGWHSISSSFNVYVSACKINATYYSYYVSNSNPSSSTVAFGGRSVVVGPYRAASGSVAEGSGRAYGTVYASGHPAAGFDYPIAYLPQC